VQLQILVSLRPKPNTGPDADVQEYTPVGDVSVRLRIEPEKGDAVQRAQEGAWLSVLCMPLPTARKFTDLVAVRVCPDREMPGQATIRAVPGRIFAPGGVHRDFGVASRARCAGWQASDQSLLWFRSLGCRRRDLALELFCYLAEYARSELRLFCQALPDVLRKPLVPLDESLSDDQESPLEASNVASDSHASADKALSIPFRGR